MDNKTNFHFNAKNSRPSSSAIKCLNAKKTLLATALLLSFSDYALAAPVPCDYIMSVPNATECDSAGENLTIDIVQDINDPWGLYHYGSGINVVINQGNNITIHGDVAGLRVTAAAMDSSWMMAPSHTTINTSGKITSGLATDADLAPHRPPDTGSSSTGWGSTALAPVSAGVYLVQGQISGTTAYFNIAQVNQGAGGEIINSSGSKDSAAVYMAAGKELEVNSSGKMISTVGDGIRFDALNPTKKNGQDLTPPAGPSHFRVNLNQGSELQGGAAGAAVHTYGGETSTIVINQGASIGALSDELVKNEGYTYYYNYNGQQTKDYAAAKTTVRNAGEMTGVMQLSSGQDTVINESTGVWTLRQWSDSDRDGIRDTVADVATSEFGGGQSVVINRGTIQLAALDQGGSEAALLANLNTFQNEGRVVLVNGSVGGKLTIDGNYVGQGGTIAMDINTDETEQTADLLEITGSASGKSYVSVNNLGTLTGELAGDGIELIKVDGQSAANSFALAQKLKSEKYDYLLMQGGSTGANNWYLRHFDRIEAVGYMAAPYMNAEYGFETISTMRDRLGDELNRGDERIWGRVGGFRRDDNTGSLKYKTDAWYVQYGADMYYDQDAAGNQTLAGIIFTLGQQNTKGRSDSRPDDAQSKLTTHAYSVGGYYSLLADNKAYVDLVGQWTYYDNRYYADVDAKQKGYGVIASVEAGYPFSYSNGWAIEPQAQLMYQYLYLKEFNDGYGRVDSLKDNVVKSRLGLRVSKEVGSFKPYANIDILHNFTDSPSISIGDKLFDPGFARTWWQVGAGLDFEINESTSLYSSINYQKDFDNTLDGYSANLGLKVRF